MADEKPKRGSELLRFIDRYWVFLYLSPLMVWIAFADRIFSSFDPLWMYTMDDQTSIWMWGIFGLAVLLLFIFMIYSWVRPVRPVHQFQLLLLIPIFWGAGHVRFEQTRTGHVLDTIEYSDRTYHVVVTFESDWDAPGRQLAIKLVTCDQNNMNCTHGIPHHRMSSMERMTVVTSCGETTCRKRWWEVYAADFVPTPEGLHLCLKTDSGVYPARTVDKTEHLNFPYREIDAADCTFE